MSERPSAIFLIQLVQDVNMVRPLVFMAARDFGFETLLLVSTKFLARDAFGIWSAELDEIADQAGCRVQYFDNDWEAHRQITGRGLLFSASESHLPNHLTTHAVFRHAPTTYLKVTIQHGFECVGFHHSSDHDRAHGPTASFGADIVCAWSGSHLSSLAPSQRGKLVVTGPTSVLQLPAKPTGPEQDATGLVCENLHSVRFGGTPPRTSKTEFVTAFKKFARCMADKGKEIALRPHSGGQFYIRNRIALPPNVTIENAPLYRIDLSRFAFGISAPSSVLIDMLLADLPTAVWLDRDGEIDASSYRGLPIVSSAREWVDFARTAERQREQLLARQRSFLEKQGMVTDPEIVFARFAELFQAAVRMGARDPGALPEKARLLFVTDEVDRSAIDERFTKPLTPLVARGELVSLRVTTRQLADVAASGTNAVTSLLDAYAPSAIVVGGDCPLATETLVEWARRRRVPLICYVSQADDLLVRKGSGSDPVAAGQANRALLFKADLAYAANKQVKSALSRQFPGLRVAGPGKSPRLPEQSMKSLRADLLEMVELGRAAVGGSLKDHEEKDIELGPHCIG